MEHNTIDTAEKIAEAIIDAQETFRKDITLQDVLTGGVVALHAIYSSQLPEGETISLIDFAEDLPRLAAMLVAEVSAAAEEGEAE